MKDRITINDISNVFSKALQVSSLINSEDTSIIFYDFDFLEERIHELKKQFPPSTLHAIAVKANPLVKILEKLLTLDVGLEVASLPELYIALKVGFTADKIVFDSPSKTIDEINYALRLGVNINADSFDELDRISKFSESFVISSKIGVRINPQVGTGSIKSTSVADKISKFGIPIENNRQKLLEYFLKYQWITGVHFHIGSQGCPVNLLIAGAKKVYEFITEINQLLSSKQPNRRIFVFDIGGGLPVSYHLNTPLANVRDYAQLIENAIPEIFSKKYQIVTEFGRYIHANTGWVASKVEYVKIEKDFNIVMIHLGADFFIRKCYNPDDWHHEITILDKNGNIKNGKERKKYIIAGPLCFAGDIIAKDIELPCVNVEDYVIIHDTGAYTLSMWSRYNSRQIPKVIGYSNAKSFISIIKKRESIDELYKFWS